MNIQGSTSTAAVQDTLEPQSNGDSNKKRAQFCVSGLSFRQQRETTQTSTLVKDLSDLSLRQKSSEKRKAPKVRKILSLDGGGVRGLSIIMMLKEFDMIAGKSTGE